MPTLCTIEPCFHMTSRSWLSWEWRLLLSWAFILSVTFFQFWNSFMTQTPPVAVWHSLLWSIYKLCKTHHWCLHHYIRQLKEFSQFFFSSLSKAESTLYKPSWGVGSAISEQESEQLDPFSVWVLELATEEHALAPKKERISMSSCRYLIDPPNLANYQKKSV